MTTLHALRHVSSAVRHAEALADEADDLGSPDLGARLRDKAKEVARDLEAAVAGVDECGPAADLRRRAHTMLMAVFTEVTLRLEQIYEPEEASRLSPGGHLDVAERTRYRLRRLPREGSELLLDARALMEKALFTYESAVDGYLNVCADAQAKKDRAVVRSQALRLELERAKHALLVQAAPGSPAHKRIQRRAVRTKRARWLDEARAQRLLGDVFEDAPAAP